MEFSATVNTNSSANNTKMCFGNYHPQTVFKFNAHKQVSVKMTTFACVVFLYWIPLIMACCDGLYL